MTYLIDILAQAKRKQCFRIEAQNEHEAKERLKERLAPDKRENFSIESIRVDRSTLPPDEPYGVFGGE